MKTARIPGLPAPMWHCKSSFLVAILWVTLIAAVSVSAEETSLRPSPVPSGQPPASGSSTSGADAPTAGGAPVDLRSDKESGPQAPIAAQTELPTPDSASASTETSGTGSSKVTRKKVEKIEVGDRVTVKIYPEDQYIKGGDMEVSSEGTITLPLLGRVTVQDLTIRQAEQKITEALAKDYLVNPVVVVEVADRIVEKKEQAKKGLSILGQVQKPGSYDFPPEGKMTLLEVISKAGGFTDVANTKNIKIVRKKNGKANAIHANAESIIAGKDPDVELEPDDVIHVGESFF